MTLNYVIVGQLDTDTPPNPPHPSGITTGGGQPHLIPAIDEKIATGATTGTMISTGAARTSARVRVCM